MSRPVRTVEFSSKLFVSDLCSILNSGKPSRNADSRIDAGTIKLPAENPTTKATITRKIFSDVEVIFKKIKLDLKFSVHAPFSSINIAETSEEIRRFFVNFLISSLRRAYEIEAEAFVLHPGRLTPFTFSFPELAKEASFKSLEELLDEAENLGILSCIECGSCSYVCPANRSLVHAIKYGKGQIMALRKAKKN